MDIPEPARPFSPSPPRENRHSASRPPSLLFGAPPPVVAPSTAFSLSGLPPSPDRRDEHAQQQRKARRDSDVSYVVGEADAQYFDWRHAPGRRHDGVVEGEFIRTIAVPMKRDGSHSTTSSSSPPLGATSILAALASPSRQSPSRTPTTSTPRTPPEPAPTSPGPPFFTDHFPGPRQGRTGSVSSLTSSRSLPRLHQPTVLRSGSGKRLSFVPPPPAHAPSSPSFVPLQQPERAHAQGHFKSASSASAITAMTAVSNGSMASRSGSGSGYADGGAGAGSSSRRGSTRDRSLSPSSASTRAEAPLPTLGPAGVGDDLDGMVKGGVLPVAHGELDPLVEENIAYTQPPQKSETIVEPPPTAEARRHSIRHEVEPSGLAVDVADIPSLEDEAREMDARARDMMAGPDHLRSGCEEHVNGDALEKDEPMQTPAAALTSIGATASPAALAFITAPATGTALAASTDGGEPKQNGGQVKWGTVTAKTPQLAPGPEYPASLVASPGVVPPAELLSGSPESAGVTEPTAPAGDNVDEETQGGRSPPDDNGTPRSSSVRTTGQDDGIPSTPEMIEAAEIAHKADAADGTLAESACDVAATDNAKPHGVRFAAPTQDSSEPVAGPGEVVYKPPYTPRVQRVRPFTFHHAPAPVLDGADDGDEGRTPTIHVMLSRASRAATPFDHRRLELALVGPPRAVAWVPGAAYVPWLAVRVVNTPVDGRHGYAGELVRGVLRSLPVVWRLADWV